MKAPDETSSPEDVVEARAVARINGFLPDIRTVADRKIETALKIADGKIDRHEMTPEEAYSVVHEIHAYRKMLRTFDVRAKMAPVAAKA